MDHFNSSRSILLESVWFIWIYFFYSYQVTGYPVKFFLCLRSLNTSCWSFELKGIYCRSNLFISFDRKCKFSTTCYLVCHVWDPNQKLIALKSILIEKKMNMLWKSNVSLNIELSPWYIHFRNITKQTSNRISLMKGTLE